MNVTPLKMIVLASSIALLSACGGGGDGKGNENKSGGTQQGGTQQGGTQQGGTQQGGTQQGGTQQGGTQQAGQSGGAAVRKDVTSVPAQFQPGLYKQVHFRNHDFSCGEQINENQVVDTSKDNKPFRVETVMRFAASPTDPRAIRGAATFERYYAPDNTTCKGEPELVLKYVDPKLAMIFKQSGQLRRVDGPIRDDRGSVQAYYVEYTSTDGGDQGEAALLKSLTLRGKEITPVPWINEYSPDPVKVGHVLFNNGQKYWPPSSFPPDEEEEVAWFGADGIFYVGNARKNGTIDFMVGWRRIGD